MKISENLSQPYVEEILPDGHHEIIFHLNSTTTRKRCDSESWSIDPTAYFTGQNRKSYTSEFNPGSIIYGIRFHPHTQALFYDFPATATTDKLISLSDISPSDILSDCINESPEKTFAYLEREFTKKVFRLKNYNNAFQYVDAAVRTIIAKKGNINVGLLEKITGVSARHLENAFQKFVGVSPKQLSNITRYNNFIVYKKNHPEKTLTECACEADFHDQSHLIHLSRSITGQSPKSYFKRLNYINNIFLET